MTEDEIVAVFQGNRQFALTWGAPLMVVAARPSNPPGDFASRCVNSALHGFPHVATL